MEWGFKIAYNWLAGQMRKRVGPPVDVHYPIWVWHMYDWRHEKLDLRRAAFRNYRHARVCIELEIPDTAVLLSNEDAWHIVLNNGFYGDADNEIAYEEEDKWFVALRQDEQIRIKRGLWEKYLMFFRSGKRNGSLMGNMCRRRFGSCVWIR